MKSRTNQPIYNDDGTLFNKESLDNQVYALMENGEPMEGYSFTKGDTFTWTPIYIGVCKNGNKITFVVFGDLTYVSGTPGTGAYGYFTIPSDIGTKLIPYTMGGTEDILQQKYSQYFDDDSNASTPKNAIIDMSKASNTKINVNTRLLQNAGFTLGHTYVFRFEATFLLNDNLAE